MFVLLEGSQAWLVESCRDGCSSERYSGLIGGKLQRCLFFWKVLRPDWWRTAEMVVLLAGSQA